LPFEENRTTTVKKTTKTAKKGSTPKKKFRKSLIGKRDGEKGANCLGFHGSHLHPRAKDILGFFEPH